MQVLQVVQFLVLSVGMNEQVQVQLQVQCSTQKQLQLQAQGQFASFGTACVQSQFKCWTQLQS
jgi:hypothetical protein